MGERNFCMGFFPPILTTFDKFSGGLFVSVLTYVYGK